MRVDKDVLYICFSYNNYNILYFMRISEEDR